MERREIVMSILNKAYDDCETSIIKITINEGKIQAIHLDKKIV
jgi:hypothetical protein